MEVEGMAQVVPFEDGLCANGQPGRRGQLDVSYLLLV